MTLKLISFDELMTRLDEVGSVQVELIKEVLSRYFEGKLNEIEYQEFTSLQITKSAQISDAFPSCDKKQFVEGAKVIADLLYAQNR